LPASEAVLYDAISPNYFTAMRGALVKGRYFTEQDHASAERVAVINESLARRFFAEQDPLDQFVTLNYLGQPQTRRIVGVVRDMNQGEPGKVQPQLYAPYAQQPWFSAALVVRTRTSPSSARRSIQTALWSVDARQPVSRAGTAEELLADKLAEPRLYTALLSLFGALALVLSAIGLFGQISYNVSQRTQEFGIRLALGAQPRQILRQVLGLGMSLTMLGLLAGVAVSAMLTKTLGKLLYGVTATDPLTFAVIAFLLLSVAALACWIPARRTLKLDPMIALRYE
jgi:putative ABC transport system permease protein